jgi:hypothetical protein
VKGLAIDGWPFQKAGEKLEYEHRYRELKIGHSGQCARHGLLRLAGRFGRAKHLLAWEKSMISPNDSIFA